MQRRVVNMELTEKNENTSQALETLKVLIADDDPPTRVLLRAAISQWGYEVIEAKDGEEAWELLQQPEVPRLLIVDWLMPRLDGIDLCRRIKQELAHRPYIILLTQVAGTANIIKGLEAGADEFLSKPFNMAELRSRLSVGTRIVKYENTLAEQNRQLQTYAMKMDALAEERAKQLVHNTDLMVMLISITISIADALRTQTGSFISIKSSIEKNNIRIIFEDTHSTLTANELENKLQFSLDHPDQDEKKLNIAMSREIFKKYGGELLVENRTEGGVRIVVAIPITK